MAGWKQSTGLALCLAVIFSEGPALAADMPDTADIPIIEAPEFLAVPDSGFYARVDGAYRLGQAGTAGYFVPGFGAMDNETLGDSFAIGVGAGYRVNEFFRFDATVDYGFGGKVSGDLPCPGTCTTHNISADVESITGLVNAYAEIGDYAGFTPYIGAGVGAAYVSTSDATVSIPLQYDGVSRVNFAYALMAGVAYDINDQLTVDLGYRFSDIGDIDLAPNPGTPAGDPLRFSDNVNHEIRVGLRYNFW